MTVIWGLESPKKQSLTPEQPSQSQDYETKIKRIGSSSTIILWSHKTENKSKIIAWPEMAIPKIGDIEINRMLANKLAHGRIVANCTANYETHAGLLSLRHSKEMSFKFSALTKGS